jgi:hypothetical protein
MLAITVLVCGAAKCAAQGKDDWSFKIQIPQATDSASDKLRSKLGAPADNNYLAQPKSVLKSGTPTGSKELAPVPIQLPMFSVPALGIPITGVMRERDPNAPDESLLKGRVVQSENHRSTTTFGILGIQWRVSAYPTVLRVFPDTPAAQAGIQPGDEITAIDSKSLAGLSIDDVTSLMLDAPHTSAILSMQRQGQLRAAVIVRMDVDDIKDPEVKAAYGRALEQKAGSPDSSDTRF